MIMIKGIYKIADCVVEINSIYNDVHILCKKYEFNDKAEFYISTYKDIIDFEKQKTADDNFSEGYLETLAVLRMISNKLIEKNIILFHGSALSFSGDGYIFSAKSGTGKSTHARIWRERFGNSVKMINDDKPMIKITDNSAFVYGTPWNGKHRLGENISAPIKAICFLKRSEVNSIKKTEALNIYPQLLSQVYKPTDKALFEKTLDLLRKLCSCVDFYELECNMEPEAAEVALGGMK